MGFKERFLRRKALLLGDEEICKDIGSVYRLIRKILPGLPGKPSVFSEPPAPLAPPTPPEALILPAFIRDL